MYIWSGSTGIYEEQKKPAKWEEVNGPIVAVKSNILDEPLLRSTTGYLWAYFHDQMSAFLRTLTSSPVCRRLLTWMDETGLPNYRGGVELGAVTLELKGLEHAIARLVAVRP